MAIRLSRRARDLLAVSDDEAARALAISVRLTLTGVGDLVTGLVVAFIAVTP
jgi:NAD(P)H-hydrate repair Nnr-like enzyme with NAD(P)H-hydrate dehydratase domain